MPHLPNGMRIDYDNASHDSVQITITAPRVETMKLNDGRSVAQLISSEHKLYDRVVSLDRALRAIEAIISRKGSTPAEYRESILAEINLTK